MVGFIKATTKEVAIRRAALAATGLSQEKFAIYAGVAMPTVNRFMQGKPSTEETEEKIVSAFRRLGWELGKRGLWRVSTEPRKPVSDAMIAAALG